MYRRIGLAALALVAAAACSSEEPAAEAGQTTTATGAGTVTSTESVPLSDADRAAAPDVAKRFAEAANAGDAEGVAATFAEDARFDSVGRIYPSRQEIMDRFLTPEVIEPGGRYEVTGERWNGDRYRVDYDFDTGRGGSEVFYYEFLVRDGLIQDVIGRYS
ncbi:nuclear transport factor 2 family protein [Actinosynnema sp. NPDC050801]|uniref:nuclear transport factor 2 family protein n=1 Tax=unclassified Actinosynnema TaxID=2637065 RepID=UPI0033FEF8D6